MYWEQVLVYTSHSSVNRDKDDRFIRLIINGKHLFDESILYVHTYICGCVCLLRGSFTPPNKWLAEKNSDCLYIGRTVGNINQNFSYIFRIQLVHSFFYGYYIPLHKTTFMAFPPSLNHQLHEAAYLNNISIFMFSIIFSPNIASELRINSEKQIAEQTIVGIIGFM